MFEKVVFTDQQGHERHRFIVSDLVSVFRESLIALVPILEKVGVTWPNANGYEGYDQWDEIAETLFDNVVIDPIFYAITAESRESLLWSKYDINYQDYSSLSYVLVRPETSSELLDARLVFLRFSSKECLFDTVSCVPINEQGFRITADTVSLNVVGAKFSFRHWSNSGEKFLDTFEIEP